jgi:8-oxo-dGTP diphosphatase
VFREGRVLVGRRARPPMAGRFSLPGGVVELGETLIEAAKRELLEEVGVEAEIVAFNRHVEPILREGGRVRTHFVIASFVGRWRRGEARVSKETDAVAWIEPEACASLLTTPELGEILECARRIEREQR